MLVGWEHAGDDPDASRGVTDDVIISVITVSELLHGVHRAEGAVRARRLAFVEHLLSALPAIPIREPIARMHAQLWAELAARGQMIGVHDLWIAATALSHDLPLVTGNAREFERVPGLRVLPVAT